MFKQQKGITLIALVITIIVLLILAGVTIAMLTGSDSAPTKANEATQKQDIGACKDQVYISATDLQTIAYEKAYVDGKDPSHPTVDVTDNGASESIGTYVGNELNGKITTKTIGTATITVINPATTTTMTNVKDIKALANVSAYVTITTTDYQTIGWINKDGGALEWTKDGIVATEAQ